MTDRFASRAQSLDGPATHGFAITPNDATPLTETCRALYVGVAGDIALVLASGAAVTFVGVAASTLLPVRAKTVKATGTTASSIVALV